MISAANAPAIVQICHRLDGIPLAIELAAARSGQLSADRIAAELDDRFRLLTGGARTVMRRQQTLAASIDWSHERLDVEERLVFRRLGVFSGEFPLEAAEAVTVAPGGLALAHVFDVISRLVDKNLIVVGEGADGEPRYRQRGDDARGCTRTRRRRRRTRRRCATPTRRGGRTGSTELRHAHRPGPSAGRRVPRQPQIGTRLGRGPASSRAAPPRTASESVGATRKVQRHAIPSADRLLSAADGRQHTGAWLVAANAAAGLYLGARGLDEWHALLDRIDAVAIAAGDEYHLASSRLHRGGLGNAPLVADLARQRGDDYLSIRA